MGTVTFSQTDWLIPNRAPSHRPHQAPGLVTFGAWLSQSHFKKLQLSSNSTGFLKHLRSNRQLWQRDFPPQHGGFDSTSRGKEGRANNVSKAYLPLLGCDWNQPIGVPPLSSSIIWPIKTHSFFPFFYVCISQMEALLAFSSICWWLLDRFLFRRYRIFTYLSNSQLPLHIVSQSKDTCSAL